ncbi:MAG: hypothetical protein FJ290_21760 [Planctomycetes bacterium]|nr:hypothetical protein [Planctomycetota bacterium]
MASVLDIEREIARLAPDDLAELRAWFAEFDAAAWDEQLERDVRAGKLDALAERALDDFRRGRCKEL